MKVKNWSLQLISNLSKWKEEAWKNQGFNRIRTCDLMIPGRYIVAVIMQCFPLILLILAVFRSWTCAGVWEMMPQTHTWQLSCVCEKSRPVRRFLLDQTLWWVHPYCSLNSLQLNHLHGGCWCFLSCLTDIALWEVWLPSALTFYWCSGVWVAT